MRSIDINWLLNLKIIYKSDKRGEYIEADPRCCFIRENYVLIIKSPVLSFLIEHIVSGLGFYVFQLASFEYSSLLAFPT